MRKCSSQFAIGVKRVSLGFLCGIAMTPAIHAQYASSVISYNAGTGATAGYNDPSTALGTPSTFTNDPRFPSAVDPYDPPYLADQIVSIGAGGSLTLQLGAPIRNDSAHAFGLDFIVYGNAGFIADFQTGISTGALFGADATGTRVSVSADNVTYFTLDPNLAPIFDSYFPTDGAGAFGQPVNPSLANAASFNGLTMDQIRAEYGGSAGGTGYDLSWARDAGGNPVALDSINYVRLDVVSGKAEIDGVVGVPEPSTWALLGIGVLTAFARKRRA
jgi:hypothetical protein